MRQSVTLNPISNFSAHRPHQAREAADTSSYIDPKYRFIEERERQTWEVKRKLNHAREQRASRASCEIIAVNHHARNRNTSILARGNHSHTAAAAEVPKP